MMSGRFILKDSSNTYKGLFTEIIRVGSKIIVKDVATKEFTTFGNLSFTYIFNGDTAGVELTFTGIAFSSVPDIIIICH